MAESKLQSLEVIGIKDLAKALVRFFSNLTPFILSYYTEVLKRNKMFPFSLYRIHLIKKHFMAKVELLFKIKLPP